MVISQNYESLETNLYKRSPYFLYSFYICLLVIISNINKKPPQNFLYLPAVFSSFQC